MNEGDVGDGDRRLPLSIDMTGDGGPRKVRHDGLWLAPGAWTDCPPRFNGKCFVWFLATRRAYLVDLVGNEVQYVGGRGCQPLSAMGDVLWGSVVKA